MWMRNTLIFLFLIAAAFCYPQSRVVNGIGSDIRRYPFMASLRTLKGAHSCGCTIIAPRWILTAAHCVVKRITSTISIQYGVTDTNLTGPNIAFVKQVHIHKDYVRSGNFPNDIALLELFNDIAFDYETIAPVELPEQNYETPQVPQGTPGVLLGWGYNETNNKVAQKTLQEAQLKIYSDEDCSSRLNGTVSVNHICGGIDEGGKGQCDGDSGGPLLEILPTGLIQVGVVSWSFKPCGETPGVSVKVSHYINWIHETMNSTQ